MKRALVTGAASGICMEMAMYLHVMPESLFDDVIIKADGDVSYIEKALGYKPGSLQSEDYIAIRINNPTEYDIQVMKLVLITTGFQAVILLEMFQRQL